MEVQFEDIKPGTKFYMLKPEDVREWRNWELFEAFSVDQEIRARRIAADLGAGWNETINISKRSSTHGKDRILVLI